MIYYYGLLLSWAIIAGLGSLNQSPKRRRIFVAFAALSLFLVMACRAPSVGTDTLGYASQYRAGYFRVDEFGYSYLVAACKYLGLGFQAFVALSALLVTVSVTLLISTFSREPFLSFFLHITVGFFALSLSGLRQSIAIAIVLIGFTVLLKGHRLAFVALVLLAYTFHNSALIALLFLVLPYIKVSRLSGAIAWAGALLVGLQSWLVPSTSSLAGLSKYDVYFEATNEINPLVVISAGILPLACLALWPAHGVPYQRVRGVSTRISIPSVLYVMALINFSVTIMALGAPIVTRLGYYFTSSILLLVPNVTSNYPNVKIRRLVGFIIVALALLQFARTAPRSSLGISDYHLFWMQP